MAVISSPQESFYAKFPSLFPVVLFSREVALSICSCWLLTLCLFFTTTCVCILQVFDSTLNRQNTAGSRLPGSISSGGQHGAVNTSSITTNRHFNSETSTSSARRPPSLQRSTPFVDQFAFTEEEMGIEDDLFSTEQSTHSGTWPNRDRSPPLIRNGRNHNVS